jgi:hypothetical protein
MLLLNEHFFMATVVRLAEFCSSTLCDITSNGRCIDFDIPANSSRKFRVFSAVRLSAQINKFKADNYAYSLASSAFSIQEIAALLTPHESNILAIASRTKRLSSTIKICSSTDTLPL